MNISTSNLLAFRQRDGAPAEDRAARVAESLAMPRRVGWQEGKPLVPHPDGADQELQLGDDVSDAYNHYLRNENILRPGAYSQLETLVDAPEVTSIDDVAAELQTDKGTVRRALELHSLGVDADGDGDDGTDTDGLELPSGETVPFEPTHPLTLAQLASDGMGVGEMARWLSAQSGEKVTADDVRSACREYGYLDGGDGSRSVPPRPGEVHNGSGEYAHEPWD